MAKLLKLIDPYIGLMLLTVAVAAVMPAQGQGAVVAEYAVDFGIILLFFLHGTRLSPQAAIGGILQWKLHLAVLGCTFVLFPAIGLAMRPVLPSGFPAALTTGMLFLCILPSTVQSSIAFTSIARGNVPAALCAASVSNILGVLISPILAAWLLETQGVQMSLAIFRDIALQLLAPFLAGQALRSLVDAWVQRNKNVLGHADRGLILLIIYVAFSKGMVEGIWTRLEVANLGLLIAVLCVLLALVLVLTALVGRMMGLSNEMAIVLQFCGSKKSLASGLPMAMVIFAGPQLGMIVLPLMLFHQLQLIACAVLARHYGERPESACGRGYIDAA